MENRVDNDAINPSINNKKTQYFNLIIGIATLLIAIFGATFAYFTATARSREGEVSVKSAMVSINFDRGTAVKAENLIPSSERIALLKYQKTMTPFDAETDGEYIQDYDEYLKSDDHTDLSKYLDRRCIDANGREVCSVFWFSVKSDGQEGESTDILSYITVESNGFENLSYLVYEVDYSRDENDKIINDKYGFGIVAENGYHLASQFVRDESFPVNEDIPFAIFGNVQGVSDDDENLVDVVKPVACLFGEVENASTLAKSDKARCQTKSISNQVEHNYQIVIWLEETGSEQLEQGKSFQGTVAVEITGDESAEGRITGKE